ncbi:hypothetical protein BDN72DRAFT_861017 [Pluteus cervinus]|uniref:Uncharacterized protein n=1 Tax=Pluteus cervinus TaxID=181527 RepID=A0ACD3AHE6_9AGAR|nr:hypothetical protein BDN72DRAFT_861017 [Pluteus cervinus]
MADLNRFYHSYNATMWSITFFDPTKTTNLPYHRFLPFERLQIRKILVGWMTTISLRNTAPPKGSLYLSLRWHQIFAKETPPSKSIPVSTEGTSNIQILQTLQTQSRPLLNGGDASPFYLSHSNIVGGCRVRPHTETIQRRLTDLSVVALLLTKDNHDPRYPDFSGGSPLSTGRCESPSTPTPNVYGNLQHKRRPTAVVVLARNVVRDGPYPNFFRRQAPLPKSFRHNRGRASGTATPPALSNDGFSSSPGMKPGRFTWDARGWIGGEQRFLQLLVVSYVMGDVGRWRWDSTDGLDGAVRIGQRDMLKVEKVKGIY